MLGACALNADQETSLHTAMVSYVNSRNNGVVMSYVAYSHPNVVSFYKNQGDSLFKVHFDLSNENERPFFQDGLIQKIERANNLIHVKYQFKKIGFEDFIQTQDDVHIIAVSENEGETWFFIEEQDYFNDQIIKKENRLIAKE